MKTIILHNFVRITSNQTIKFIMGSSGTGRFSDYIPAEKGNSSNGNTGESSGANKCSKAFTTNLEDVSRCDYFLNNGDVPDAGTEITVDIKTRLVAKTLQGEIVGYLPTKFNYLAGCMDDGFRYLGVVSTSGTIPFAKITIDVHPE